MKLNKCFTPYYSLCFDILHYPHIFTHLSPHLYFPFPTESRNESKSHNVCCAIFLYGDEPLRACSHKDQQRTKKTAPAPAGCRFAFGSMMARGGPGCATTGSKSQLNNLIKTIF